MLPPADAIFIISLILIDLALWKFNPALTRVTIGLLSIDPDAAAAG